MKRLILIIVALLVAGGAWAQNRMDLTKQQGGGSQDSLFGGGLITPSWLPLPLGCSGALGWNYTTHIPTCVTIGAGIFVNTVGVPSTNLNSAFPSPDANFFPSTFKCSGSNCINESPHPGSGTLICYAAGFGSDTNDGLELSTAKYSVNACVDTINSAGGNGTIYVANGASVATSTDPAGCGIWIMGPTDPNYASPPSACWRKKPNGGSSIAFVGMANTGASSFSHGNQVAIAGGTRTVSPLLPAVWLSGVNSLTFKNLALSNFNCVSMMVGIGSDGSDHGVVASTFSNLSLSINAVVGCGPTMKLGGASYWNTFEDMQIQANGAEATISSSLSRASGVSTVTMTTYPMPTSWVTGTNVAIAGSDADPTFNGVYSIAVTGLNTFTYSQTGYPNSSSTSYSTISSDAGQGIVMEPGPGTASAINTLNNIYINGGGIRAYPGTTQGVYLYGYNLFQESGYAPLVDLLCVGNQAASATLINLQRSDQLVTLPTERAECGLGDVVVIDAQGGADGPGNMISSGPSSANTSPALEGQSGIEGNHVFAQVDAARWGFGPVAARWPNIVTGGGGGGATVTYPLLAPNGTSTATEFSIASGTGYPQWQASSLPIATAAGQIYLWGLWVKALNGNFNSATNGCPYIVSTYPANTTVQPNFNFRQGEAYSSNGEWVWCWGAFKLASVSSSTTATSVVISSQVTSTTPQATFAPMIVQVPAGAMSDNEAIEYAMNMQAYRSDAVAGQVSLLPGQQFKVDSAVIGSQNCVAAPTWNAGSTMAWSVVGGISSCLLLNATHNTTSTLNISGLVSGVNYEVMVNQDATGTGTTTLGLGTGCSWMVRTGGASDFSSASSVAVTATANNGNALAFTYDGTAKCWAVF